LAVLSHKVEGFLTGSAKGYDLASLPVKRWAEEEIIIERERGIINDGDSIVE